MKLSIVIPVFNEAKTLEKVVKKVLAVDFGREIEIVVVDDGSSDGTQEVIRRLAEKHLQLKGVFHPVNQGKGAALQTGFKNASGEVVIVQDAVWNMTRRKFPGW